MKRRAKLILFGIIAVLLPFIIANELLRWHYRQIDLMQYLKKDWELIFSTKRNFHKVFEYNLHNLPPWRGKVTSWELTTNSEGIRDGEEIKPKSKGDFRILCLGDSITFGQDVNDDETYPFQLEQILNKNYGKPGMKFEVINAGVTAYTSRQGLIFLDTRLLKYQPDLVILGFGFNDAQSYYVTFYRPDKVFLQGNVRSGWGKVYQNPVNLLILFTVRQPLVVFIRESANLIKMLKIMDLISKLDQAKVPIEKIHPPEDFKNSRVPPEDFQENLEQFIWLSQNHHFRLLFYITWRTPALYRSILQDFSRQHHIPVVDFSTKLWNYRLEDLLKNPVYANLIQDYREKLGDDFLRKNPTYVVSSDGMHPNRLANLIIAQEMAKTIIASYFPELNPLDREKEFQQ